MIDYLATIGTEAQRWDCMSVGKHRYGGLAFSVGIREAGHLHENGLLEVPLVKPLRDWLIREGKAQCHPLYPASGWVSFQMLSWSDIFHALWLLRLSYLHKFLQMFRQQAAALTFTPEDQELVTLLETFVE